MDYKKLLDSYIKGYDKLAETIKTIDEELFFFKPGPGKWSIKEIIIHLSDAECNAYIRFRKAAAENGCNVDVYDQDKWAAHLNYENQSIVNALALIKLMRIINYEVFLNFDEETWNNFVYHPERGKVTLAEFVEIYTDHMTDHINQIERNIGVYNKINNIKE